MKKIIALFALAALFTACGTDELDLLSQKAAVENQDPNFKIFKDKYNKGSKE